MRNFKEYLNEAEDYIMNQVLAKAKKDGVQIAGEYMVLYHGTSPANLKKIFKTNKFKAGTFFASDFETAERYSRTKISRGEPVVTQAVVWAGSIFPSTEYWTTKEDIFLGNGRYSPKGRR